MKQLNHIEKIVLLYIGVIMVLGLAMSYANHDFFASSYVVEDGFTEWLTVFGLFTGAAIAWRRLVVLRGQRHPWFLFCLFLMGCLYFLAGAEEISWGQRIFGIESSGFFVEHNAQTEINLHNLKVGDVKVNKIIAKAIGLFFLLYLFVLTPCYKRFADFARVVDSFAIPIAQKHHVIAYVVFLVLAQVLMVSSKKGEMLEVTLTWVNILNILYPFNAHIYDPARKLSG